MRQYRYFVKVVECGSMTKAAEQLRIAQPALGLQVRQMEEDLGVALLERHSRGVLPTLAGQLLYERGRQILAMDEAVRREVQSFGSTIAEAITLGLTPSLMQILAADLLIDARKELPGVMLHLVEELSFVLVDALERNEIDLALAYEVGDLPNLTRMPLLHEELLLVTRPEGVPVAAAADGISPEPISLAEALGRDLVLAGKRDTVRQLVDAAAAALSLNVRLAFEVQSVQAQKTLVANGLAASIMPYGTAIDELLGGRLVGRRIKEPRIARTLYLIRPAKRAPFRNEVALSQLLERMRARLCEVLGPLARPVGRD